MNKVKTDTIVTPIFRVSFPYVFKQGEDKNGKKYWGITMIFDPAAFTDEEKKCWGDVQRITKDAIEQAFKGQLPPRGKMPWRKGTTDEFDLEKRPEYRGKIIAPAKAFNAPPGLINAARQQIIDEAEFYPGCYARATVNCYAYNVSGNAGVAFGLNNIIKIKDGEPLVSRRSALDDFAALDVDSYADADDFFGEDDPF